MSEDHSMCHEAGCSLANIPYRLASCGCLHVDWMTRATAAEAREAKLRERAQALLDHIGPENSRVYANDVPVRLLRAAIEENQREQ